MQACVGGVASLAARVLRTPSPRDKIALTAEACAALRAGAPLGAAVAPARPAREELPPLVPQRDMPKQKASGLPLSAFLLHNLATIELKYVVQTLLGVWAPRSRRVACAGVACHAAVCCR